MMQAQMYPYEKVLVVDLENGNRLETYLIPEPAGSQTVQLNGAAARLVSVGDRVIMIGRFHRQHCSSSAHMPNQLAASF